MHQPHQMEKNITYLYITKYDYYMSGVFCDEREKNGRNGNRARKMKLRYSRSGEYFPVVFTLHNAMHTWKSFLSAQKRPVVQKKTITTFAAMPFFGAI